MKMRIQLVLLLAGALLVGACGNDPAVQGINLEMKATSTLSAFKSKSGRTSATGLQFTEVIVGIHELEFETEAEDLEEDNSGEDPSDEIEFKGPFVVDLINGTSTPDFGLGNLQPGMYDKIEIEMGPVLQDGSTIRIGFTYDSKTVIFSTNEEIELEIENASQYQLDANTVANILVLLDLDALFANIDLSTAVADADGVIRINKTSNSEIQNQILATLENSCDAGEDDNHDDQID